MIQLLNKNDFENTKSFNIDENYKILALNHNLQDVNNTEITAIDINKCHSYILREGGYSKQGWLKFTGNNMWCKYNDEKIVPGIYLIKNIENDKFGLLKGNGIFSHDMINYCLEKNIITKKNIKYAMRADETIKNNYFSDFVNNCFQLFPDEQYPKIAKNIVNLFIGLLGKNIDINEKRLYTFSLDDGKHYEDFHDALFLGVENKNEKELYCIRKIIEHKLLNSNKPIYNQIVENSRILAHQKYLECEGDFIGIKTDELYFINLKKSPVESKEIGGVKIKKINELKITPYNYNTEYKINFDNDWKIIEKNERFANNEEILKLLECSKLIEGKAGVGKSFLIKVLKNYFDANNIKYDILSFTNKASELIDGQTIHSKLKINYFDGCVSGSIDNIINNTEYIIIDEVSMIPIELWQILYSIKIKSMGVDKFMDIDIGEELKPKLKFICFGDYNQLPPVNEQMCKDSYIVKTICDYNLTNLSYEPYRNGKFYEYIEKSLNNKNIISLYNNEMKDRGICYTHEARKYINKIISDKYGGFLIERNKAEGKIDGDSSAIGGYTIDEKTCITQDIYVNVKTPIISYKKYKDIKNNTDFIVTKIDDKSMIIIDKKGNSYEILNSEFSKHFIVNWVSTVYRVQGSTWDFPYTIYEVDKLKNIGPNNNGLYVALTRATKQEYINIY